MSIRRSLAAARLGPDVVRRFGNEGDHGGDRAPLLRALYTTLDRLEEKGLITTSMGDPTPVRGGRPKRLIRVTAKGRREGATFYRIVMRVSNHAYGRREEKSIALVANH